VAVLAVDPSSPFTGGALLGDRVRIAHAGANVFFRSLASRGHGGGLAPRMREVLSLLAAHGFDTVLIETVGIGQEDVAITSIADVTAVVTTPAGGDSVQAEKAGLLEAAQIVVLNKCDLAGAPMAERDLAENTGLPVVKMTAKDGVGAAELLAALRAHRVAARSVLAGFAIDHIGIASESLASGLAFYRDLLGMRLTLRERVEHEGVEVAMLDAGESRIELLEATGAESTIAKFIAKRGAGIHHIALRVPNFDAVVARLQTLNEPRTGAGGHRYVFIHPATTGGVLLELIADD
jgi:LAO/AO transport system kinase